jgi:hypothetical protein
MVSGSSRPSVWIVCSYVPSDDLLSELLDVVEPELAHVLGEVVAPDLVARDLGVDVAQHLFGRAHVGRDQVDQGLVRRPRVVQLGDRDEQPLLEHLARIGRQPAAADVDRVTRAAEEAHELAAVERGTDDREVVELARRLPRIVRDQHVAGRQLIRRVDRQEVLHRRRERVDVTRCAGVRLREHPAARVEERRGEVAGLAHDRREGRAHEGRRLLVHHGDEPRPEDLEGDRVQRRLSHRSPPPGFRPRRSSRGRRRR